MLHTPLHLCDCRSYFCSSSQNLTDVVAHLGNIGFDGEQIDGGGLGLFNLIDRSRHNFFEVTAHNADLVLHRLDQADANEALIEKARSMGANAVVNITYSSGIGFTTWGYIDAKGTAVRLAR